MRVLALVKRIIHQMLRDKRALALMMVAPLLILTLLHYLLGSNTVDPRMGVTGADASLVKQLKSKDIIVNQYTSRSNWNKVMEKDDLDAVLEVNENDIKLVLQNDQPSATKALLIKVQQAIASESAKNQSVKMAQFMQEIQSK